MSQFHLPYMRNRRLMHLFLPCPAHRRTLRVVSDCPGLRRPLLSHRSRYFHLDNPTQSKRQSSRPGGDLIASCFLYGIYPATIQEYFADGLTESLIGRLSMFRGLRVISRTSAMQFKNTSMSAPQIGSALQVDALVEGSVIREGGRVRVHAQLIRAATDEHFWSETYDREMQDTLALESDVAQAIAQKVEVTLSGEERARLVAARPVSPEVYESYLKGRRLVDGNPRTKSKAAFDTLKKPSARTPLLHQHTLAWRMPTALGTVFFGAPALEMRPKVIAMAQKALELDPDLADAHAQLADAYQKQWQWNDAEGEYIQTIQLKPHDAFANRDYAEWLLCQGRIDEALTQAQHARELDPLGDSSVTMGWILFQSHRYDEAIRELRSVITVHPDLAAP